MQRFLAHHALASLTCEDAPPLFAGGCLPSPLALLRARETTPGCRLPRHLPQHALLPSGPSRSFRVPGGRVYSVQYSPCGALLAAADQDRVVAVFEAGGGGGGAAGAARLHAAFVPRARWAVTELAWVGSSSLIYSTLDSSLYRVAVPAERQAGRGAAELEQQPLALGGSGGWGGPRVYSFAVAPGDGELAIATSDGNLVLYSLEAAKVLDTFPAHADDINSVCYLAGAGGGADVICSASDDGLVQLSDRRSARKVAGVLAGHQAGITSVASRGDSIYLCSNGKDQCVKVWDVRRALSAGQWGEGAPSSRGSRLAPNPLPHAFDYRQHAPSPAMYAARHARDASVATLRGGCVLSTLIRAQWSPLASTGGRFIASGGADGAVCVWDLAGGARAGSGIAQPHTVLRPHGGALVRGLSWSPDGTALATGGFDGRLTVSCLAEGGRAGGRAAHAHELRERLGLFLRASQPPELMERVIRAHDALTALEARAGAGRAGGEGGGSGAASAAASAGGELEVEEAEEAEGEEEEEEEGDDEDDDDDEADEWEEDSEDDEADEEELE